MQRLGAPTQTRTSEPPTTKNASPGFSAPQNRFARVRRRAENCTHEAGVAAVEFAIGAILLLLLGFGAWEYGLFLNKGQTLASGVRTSIRVAATACIPASDLDSRVAADPDCREGNKASDDFDTLRSLQASLGSDWKDVERILVYKVPPGGVYKNLRGGRPPSFCRNANGEVTALDEWCNVYTQQTVFPYGGDPNTPLLKNLDKFFYTSSEIAAQNTANAAATPPLPPVAAGDAKADLINEVFNCDPTKPYASPSLPFCPTKKDSAGDPVRKRGLGQSSNLGIYVKMNHNMITGMFGRQQKIEQWSLFRLEPSPYDNVPYACTGSQCDAAPPTANAVTDIRVTKTVDKTEVLPDEDLTYTITVLNAGPTDASGLTVKDAFPVTKLVTLGNYTCTATGSAVCPSASGTVLDDDDVIPQFPVNGKLTYVWPARAKTTASGLIVNTASVVMPTGISDSDTSNNSAQTTTPIVKPDLRISKFDDQLTNASPYQDIVYKLWIENDGAVNVANALVNIDWDSPAKLNITSWQCTLATTGAVCGTANNTSGTFSDTVTIPKLGRLEYEVRGRVRADATGVMNPVAKVTLPGTLIDETPTNNQAPDFQPTTITAPDLAITKTDGATKTEVGPLEVVTYTIVAKNLGLFRVEGVSITDNPPASLTNISWTCAASPGNTCPHASGTNGIAETNVTLAAGSNLTYTMVATVAANVTGTVDNTAIIAGPPGLVEQPSSPNNNVATDSDLVAYPKLIVVKDDGITEIAPGMAVDYTITVSNIGGTKSFGARIIDTLPATILNPQWTCTAATGGAVCPAGASTSLNTTVDIPVSGGLTFHQTGTLSLSATGTLNNVVDAKNAVGIPVSNDGTDDDVDNIRFADVQVTKTRTPTTSVSPGDTITYTVGYKNNGPGVASNVTLTDNPPANLSTVSWSCVAGGGAVCPTTATRNLSAVVSLPQDATLTFIGTATVATSASTPVVNDATNTFTNDSNTLNDISSVSNAVVLPNLGVTLTASPAASSNVGPKTPIVYTLTVKNYASGPGGSAPAGIVIAQNLPTQLTGYTWTCTGVSGATCPAASGSGPFSVTTTSPLAAGQSLKFTITGTTTGTPTRGAFTTTADITLPPGLVEANATYPNTATISHTIVHPDVTLTKSASVSNAGPGQTFTYTLVATNIGPGVASSARIVDTFDATKFVTTPPISWTCTAAGSATCPTSSGTGNISETTGDFPAGGTLTYVATVKLQASARTSVSNSASIAYTNTLVDPVLSNNTPPTVVVTISQPDLIATKDDFQTDVSPNQTYPYTLTFTNAGPGPVTGATIADTVDTTKLTVVSWSCVASGGAACPTTPTTSLNATVDFPASSSLTFTLTVTVKPTATGTVANRAVITAPVAVGDRDITNNDQTDTDNIVIPDLSVTKTDNQTSATAGQVLTYTIVARNLGPGPVSNAILTDTPPTQLTSLTWKCYLPQGGGVCPTPSSGSLTGGVLFTSIIPSLPALSQVTYEVSGTVANLATGSIIQNVALNHPNGTVEPPGTNGNNTATDPTTITVADLTITKSNGIGTTASPGTVAGGQVLTYDVITTNTGSGPVTGATIADTPPAGLITVSWACFGTSGGASCPSPGATRNLSVTANIPAGGSITYRMTGTVDPALTSGTIAQTATVTQPNGWTDPTPGNNTATDTDNIGMSDLKITKTDGQTNVGPGQALTYTIVASNLGPGPVTNATITDTLPAALTGVTYKCSGTNGATCPTGTPLNSIITPSGSPITITGVNLNSGKSITFTLYATVTASATGTFDQIANIERSSGTLEPGAQATNNTAKDTDTVQLPDPWATKTVRDGTRGRGEQVQYTIQVGNAGPGPVPSVPFSDPIPSQILSPAWTCVAVGATCPSGASGSLTTGATLSQTITNLAKGATVTYTITGNVGPTATSATVTNTATITPSIDRDTSTTSNRPSITFDIVSPDLSMTKSNGLTSVLPGQTFSYTLTARNNGPGSVTGAIIEDKLIDQTNFTQTGWTCSGSGGVTCPTASGTTNAIGSTNSTIGLMADGATLTYTVTGNVPASASGVTANTARIVAPATITETDSLNNVGPDSDPITQPDVSINKTNNQTQLFPGQVVTYDLLVKNNGATPSSNVRVTDAPPALLLTGTSPWSCVLPTGGATCTAPSSARNLDVTLGAALPAGATVTYRLAATVSGSAAPGTLANTAFVTGNGDTATTGNNTSTDSDPIVHPDLQLVSVNDTVSTVSTVWPSYVGSYAIVVKNNGPGPVTGARVFATIPASLTNVSWTCTATSGSSCPAGPINTGLLDTSSVNLLANGTATFTLNYTVANNFAGSIVTKAEIVAPSGIVEANTTNNKGPQDTNTSQMPDITVVKDDFLTSVYPGQNISYSIIVANSGPAPVNGIVVNDALPAALVAASTSWTCTATGGGSCPAGPTAGGISNQVVNLPNGATATFVLSTRVAMGASGTLTNNASAAIPTGVFTDRDTANNADGDDDAIVLPDVSVTKTDGRTSINAGDSAQYTILVTNAGPGPSGPVAVQDLMPTELTAVTWSCSVVTGASDGAACSNASGSGDINTTVNLPAVGNQIRFYVNFTVKTTATGTLNNRVTATLSLPNDRNTPNNTADDIPDTIVPYTAATTTTLAPTTTRRGGGL